MGREAGGGFRMGNTCKSFNVWQKPLQYCKVISLQPIKINGKKKKNNLVGPEFAKLPSEIVFLV